MIYDYGHNQDCRIVLELLGRVFFLFLKGRCQKRVYDCRDLALTTFTSVHKRLWFTDIITKMVHQPQVCKFIPKVTKKTKLNSKCSVRLWRNHLKQHRLITVFKQTFTYASSISTIAYNLPLFSRRSSLTNKLHRDSKIPSISRENETTRSIVPHNKKSHRMRPFDQCSSKWDLCCKTKTTITKKQNKQNKKRIPYAPTRGVVA